MRVWDLRETAEDRQIGEQLDALEELLATVCREALRLEELCAASQSNRIGEEMCGSGIDDPPALGFHRAGGLSLIALELEEQRGRLRALADETVENLLAEGRSGTADLNLLK